MIEERYEIEELLKPQRIRSLFESFTRTNDLTITLFSYPERKVVFSTGSREICTKYHHRNPESARHCLKQNLPSEEHTELTIRRCANGLVEGITPIFIRGVHVADLMTGQVLLEEPDPAEFRRRAAALGFDVSAYIEALRRVPVVSKEKLSSILEFVGELTVLVGETGLSNMKTREARELIEHSESSRRRQAIDALDYQKQILDSEEKHRRIFDESPIGILYFNNEGVITDCNAGLVGIIGSSKEDLIGFNMLTDVIDKTLTRVVAETLAEGSSVYEGWYNSTTAHKTTFVRILFQGIRNHRGVITAGMGMIEDITERRLAEEALRKSEERFRNLADLLPEAIFETDMQLNVTYANSKGLELFGLSRDDLLDGIKGIDLFTEEDQQRVKTNLKNRVSGEEFGAVEYLAVRKDGSRVPVLFHSNVIRAGDELVGFRGAVMDISERYHAEEERRKLQDQLNQSQKMESVGRLAGGVAHDFNNMLNVILGNSDLIISELPDDSALMEDIVEIRRAARRSADLTRQLLAFARKQTIIPKILDINEAVEGVLKMLRRLIGENISLRWKPTPDLPPVRIDPAQIDQVLANLVVNSRDAIVESGTIIIETGVRDIDEAFCAARPELVPGRYVVLALSDDGQGMDGETLAHIFEPFFTTKGVGEGTGLGLATVYGIVTQNDGFIHAYSELGGGTTFHIYLPVSSEAAPRHSRASSIAPPVTRGAETILLVEDEAAILVVGEKILRKLGYNVLIAGSPREGIKIAMEHPRPIDLLITDVIMPEMNGRDMAARIKSLHPAMETIFMSGYTADVIAHKGVLQDGVNFLQKPFSVKDIDRTVRQVLDSRL